MQVVGFKYLTCNLNSNGVIITNLIVRFISYMTGSLLVLFSLIIYIIWCYGRLRVIVLNWYIILLCTLIVKSVALNVFSVKSVALEQSRFFYQSSIRYGEISLFISL